MDTKQNMDIIKKEAMELCRNDALMEDVRQFLLQKGIEEKQAQELSIYYFLEVQNQKKEVNNTMALIAAVIGIVLCIVGFFILRPSFVAIGFMLFASAYAVNTKIKKAEESE